MNQNKPVKNQRHACASCRTSKIRCLVDTFKEHGKCRHCHQAKKECIFDLSTAPRQKRQRTDTRIVLLEKEVKALKAAFNAKQSNSERIEDSSTAKSVLVAITEGDVEVARSISKLGEPAPAIPSSARHEPQSEVQTSGLPDQLSYVDTIPGCITSDILPVNTAIALLAQFNRYSLPQHPVVLVADTNDFHRLRSEKPILLFAMVTAACRSTDPVLFTTLHASLLRLLSEKVVIEGRKSLELLQAIVISEVWYDPPDDLSRLNFHMWINIAATVAIQLRLWWNVPALPDPDPQEVDREISPLVMTGWRTAFAVYLSCSTVAVSLHRPRLVDFTDDARKALNRFRDCSTYTNDKRLAAWIDLQLLAEEVEALRTKASASIDTFIQNSHHERELSRLEDQLTLFVHESAPLINGSLKVHYLYCRSKLYELVSTVSQPWREPTQFASPESHGVSLSNTTISPACIRAITMLIQSCHGILDLVLQLDLTTYLNCPTVTTVRALYALRALWTLHELAHHKVQLISQALEVNKIAFSLYLQRFTTFLENARGKDAHKVPSTALKLTGRLHEHLEILEQPEVYGSGISKSRTSPYHQPEIVEHSSHDDLETVTDPVMLSQVANEQGPQNGHATIIENPVSSSFTARSMTVPFPDYDLMTMPDMISGLNGVFYHNVSNLENESFSYDWELMATDLSTAASL